MKTKLPNEVRLFMVRKIRNGKATQTPLASKTLYYLVLYQILNATNPSPHEAPFLKKFLQIISNEML